MLVRVDVETRQWGVSFACEQRNGGLLELSDLLGVAANLGVSRPALPAAS